MALAPRLSAAAVAADRHAAYPWQPMAWLHEAGLCQAPLPTHLGGQGLNEAAHTMALLRVLKHLGHGDLVVGRLYEGHVNALQLVGQHGSAAQQAAAARAAQDGQWFGVWNTEGADGVTMALDGSAVPGDAGSEAPGRWRLQGHKLYASGAGHITRPVLTAQRGPGQWQLVMLDTAHAALQVDRSFWQPLGMRASASYRVGFQGVVVPAAALLGGPGAYYAEPAFSAGAVRFAAVQLGGAEAMHDETRRFLRGLQRTDDPYQRSRLGEMAMWVESGNLWFDGAARHAGDAVYAHLMRSFIEQVGLRVMRLAERSVGARGLLQPSPLERMHRDLTHYLRQPMPDSALAAAGAHVLASGRPSHTLWGR
jgi:alkylation response protein AidB-like acyl-CoA dehydrogenase